MKKFFNLFLFLVCVTYPVSFAEDSKFQEPLVAEEGIAEVVEPAFYDDAENREIYDFLAAEIAAKRENWDGAKQHYDELLAKKNDPEILERRIQLDQIGRASCRARV